MSKTSSMKMMKRKRRKKKNLRTRTLKVCGILCHTPANSYFDVDMWPGVGSRVDNVQKLPQPRRSARPNPLLKQRLLFLSRLLPQRPTAKMLSH